MISELDRLIEEQAADNTDRVWPERFVDFSLDATTDSGDFSFGDSIGVLPTGETVSYMRRRKGSLLGASWHGTSGGYTNHRCRCPRCTKAQAAAVREHRRRKFAEGHGTYAKYTAGCKCYYCRRAQRSYQKKYRGTPTTMVACAGCTHSFVYRKGKKYCTANCSARARMRRRRGHPMKLRAKKCKDKGCRKTFTPRVGQLYCSRLCAQRESDREYARRKRKEQREARHHQQDTARAA